MSSPRARSRAGFLVDLPERRWRLRALVPSLMAAALGCGGGGGGNEGATEATATGAGSGAGSGTGGADTGSGTGGELLPSGGPGSGGGTGDSGCKKVDFVFVVDNSVSMAAEQDALIQSFPGFMATIQSTLEATSDYHILVADTDDWGRCTESNCMTGQEDADELCIEAAGGYACNTPKEECDQIIGAGVVHPMGKGASNKVCPVEDGRRYLLGEDPGMADTFACMAQVGLAGNGAERPMDSLVAALSPGMNGAAGCNAGFLRDDAILVVTFITDDPNYEDSGTPQDWFAAVKAAKGGSADGVVVLGLTPNYEGCGSNGDVKGKHWSEFIALFGDRGREASVCSEDYTPFFQDAVAIIDQTCDTFEPPK